MESPYDRDVRICPQCRSEYQLHVTHCIDCGTPTESAWSFPEREYREQPILTLPPERRGRRIDESEDVLYLLAWGTFLEERGIPCSLEEAERGPQSIRYRLWVAEEDARRDFEKLQREFTARQTRGESLVDASPSSDECPACYSKVPPENTECPSCGLVLRTFGDEEADSSDLQSPPSVTVL
jgi:hypothetical protein